MSDAMQPDDETRARRQREWREKNEPQRPGRYKIVYDRGQGVVVLEHSSWFDAGEPNRVRLGGRWYEFTLATRGSCVGGHGEAGVPAVVGLDVKIHGQCVFVSADELEFGRVED